MKRRLFLKTSSVSGIGLAALPTLIFGCETCEAPPLYPTNGVSLFQDASRLFDSSIAELRVSGNGSLASAEAEDVDLAGIVKQITNQKAAIPAEMAENFAESSLDLINATNNLVESAPEIFPLSSGQQAELADDFALLKIVKASTLLSSAALAIPVPIRKVSAAEKMIESAKYVHSAISSGAESELIEGAGELQSHVEEYVGTAETFSASPVYITGAETYVNAANRFVYNPSGSAHADLMTSSDNLSLSASYYASGMELLNAEALFYGGSQTMSAEEFIPFSEMIVPASQVLLRTAEGVSAELGAEKMVSGSSEMLSDAESNIINLGEGAKILDVGADQFISGTFSFMSAESYKGKAFKYLEAAESFDDNGNLKSEITIEAATRLMFPASENFLSSAKALEAIKATEGVESLVNAASEMLTGAEILKSKANNATSESGAEAMLSGAELALAGAIESFENPAEFLSEGAQSIEQGAFGMMTGAEEFIEGYR